MMFTKADNINIVIPRRALEVVFDECDRYDADETGGRILGTFANHRNALTITVTGIIEPGPRAQRTATYLKQDGHYQEQVFRKVEEHEPSTEHLGNWHTHHVNRLRHLSDGDIETYRRTVEHQKHNTDFFYALLVTERGRGKTDPDRYIIRNYVFRRGDPAVYEIPASAVTLTDARLVWPPTPVISNRTEIAAHNGEDALKTNLVYDRDVISQFYPKVKSFKSKELGIYWRGPISLIDGSEQEVVVLQDESSKVPEYTVTLRDSPDTLARSSKALGKEGFASCRAALVTTERACNAELYANKSKTKKRRLKKRRLWMF